jgi:hypothetical protein
MPRHDSKEWTMVTGELGTRVMEQDRFDRAGRTGQPGQDIQRVQSG